MSSWHSYPSIYNLGHRAVKQLLNVPHYIEEKVDGSQFSFGNFTIPMGDGDMETRVRSKGAVMLIDAPEKMFSKATETVLRIRHLLHPDWTYRAEYLRTPSHNTLKYNRVPEGNLIIFDVSTEEEEWLSPYDKKVESNRIGLECVPVLSTGVGSYEEIRALLDKESCLGGTKIEGVVVKQLGPNYLYGQDKKTLIGKFVSEAFKESHSQVWKESNPTKKDIIERIISGLTTPQRWAKAVQHLREAGKLTDSPKDIPAIILEIQADTLKEEEDAIKDALFHHAKGEIERGIVRGAAEWYKEQLLKRQFE